MSKLRTGLKILLPLLAVVVGYLLMGALASQKKAPRQQVRENRGVLVETLPVQVAPFQVEVAASGTVQARQQAELAPQVAGRVVQVSPRLVEGGFFRQGETLFELEAVDYQLAVQQAESSRTEAKRNLMTVESQARVARQEWEALNLGNGEEPNPLVLFTPQMDEAKARLRSSEAALRQARLNLQRTKVTAPFNGRVTREMLDTGQFVRAGDPVVTLVGSDQVEVIVPVPLSELVWLQIPQNTGQSTGSVAQVRLPGMEALWPGRIDRSLAEVDDRGRLPRLAVTVDDPFNTGAEGAKPDLALGLFVEVVLLGPRIEEAISIPRAALRDNNQVWLLNAEGTLEIRPVGVERIQNDVVLLSEGLKAGEQLVMTPLAGATQGMKLRTAQGSRS